MLAWSCVLHHFADVIFHLILIFVSPMINDVENGFMCSFAIFASSLLKCLFSFLAHVFLLPCVFSYY